MDSQLFLISRKKNGELAATEVGEQDALGAGHSSLSSATVKGRTLIFANRTDSDRLDVYEFLASPAELRKTRARPKTGAENQVVEPFVLGNRLHLLCYSPSGTFSVLELGDDLSASKPFQFHRWHEPGATAGFSTVKPLVVLGDVVVMGYAAESGRVALYTVAVTARSPDGVPPLRMRCAWSHQWAKGWTRFAFFQFGGEPFFLKTNVVKPNVNIDHVLDDLSGAVPVGTRLELKDAQHLSVVQPFELEGGAPYFLTYEKGGEVTLNRVNADCAGWTTESTFRARPGATQVLPLSAGGRTFVLVY